MEEIWKDIEGYEGLYEVSSNGRVRSHDRLIDRTGVGQGAYVLKGRVLKLRSDRDGYILVTLSSDGIARTFKVHRLVAQAFIPNPENLSQVDHDDGRRANNRVINLKWSTVRNNLLARRSVRVNASGHRGVRKRGERFVAYANEPFTKSYKHIGTFDSIVAAVRARELFMESANGGPR